jgi:tetratricopeptide (TPR) repeat protein
MARLAEVLEQIRTGDLETAKAAIAELPEPALTRAELALAYKTGDIPRATALAGAMYRAGVWDPVVVAVLTVHGKGAIRDAAAQTFEAAREAVSIDLPAAMAQLEADPRSLASWRPVLRALVQAGRIRDAVEGVALALEEGQGGRELWAMLGAELLVARAHNAVDVAKLGVQWFPSDPDVHGFAALLLLANDELETATELAVRAVRLNPSCGLAHVAEASVLTAAGRHDDASRSLQRGVALGIDPAFQSVLEVPQG